MIRVVSSLAVGALLAVGLVLTGDRADAQGNTWGTIKGKIVWDPKLEAVPKPGMLSLVGNADKQYCETKGPIFSESLLVDPKSLGVKNIFVWLANEDIKNKKAPPIAPHLEKVPADKVKVEYDQPFCQFIPHAIGLRTGQTLLVKNSARIPHNFKYTGNPNDPDNAGGNFLMPPGTSKEVKLNADRLPVAVECNIHPWMKGWVRIFDHPYFAVTGEDGSFEIKDAPTGKFRLMVWGSSGWRGGVAGKNGEVVDLKAGGTDLGSIVFPPPKE